MRTTSELAAQRATRYGAAISRDFDDWYRDDPRWDDEATVEALFGMCRGGRALELGVGTGRLAIPLARRGVHVTGLDVAAEMIEELRTKDTEDLVLTTVADATDFSWREEPVDLVYMVDNGFLCLAADGAQEACLRRCRDVLKPTGKVVLEMLVVPPGLKPGLSWQMISEGPDEVRFEVSTHDPHAQILLVDIIVARPEGVAVVPNGARYLQPEQLDDLASRCGLRVQARWSDWAATPAAPASANHICVLTPTS